MASVIYIKVCLLVCAWGTRDDKGEMFLRADVANERMKWLCPAGSWLRRDGKNKKASVKFIDRRFGGCSLSGGFRWLPSCLLARTCCFNLANWAEILSASTAAGTTVFHSVGRRELNALMECIFSLHSRRRLKRTETFFQFPFSNICPRQFCFIKKLCYASDCTACAVRPTDTIYFWLN